MIRFSQKFLYDICYPWINFKDKDEEEYQLVKVGFANSRQNVINRFKKYQVSFRNHVIVDKYRNKNMILPTESDFDLWFEGKEKWFDNTIVVDKYKYQFIFLIPQLDNIEKEIRDLFKDRECPQEKVESWFKKEYLDKYRGSVAPTEYVWSKVTKINKFKKRFKKYRNLFKPKMEFFFKKN